MKMHTIWEKDFGDNLQCRALLHDDVLYVRGGVHLFSVTPATGAVRWATEVGSITDVLVFVGGLLVTTQFERETETFFGVNLDGEIQWQTVANINHSITDEQYLYGFGGYHHFEEDRFWRIDARTGEAYYRPFSDHAPSNLLFDKGRIWCWRIATEPGLSIYNTEGEEVERIRQQPVPAFSMDEAGVLLAVRQDDSSEVVEYCNHDWEILWSRSFPTSSRAALWNKNVVAFESDDQGDICCLFDTQNDQMIWSFPLGDKVITVDVFAECIAVTCMEAMVFISWEGERLGTVQDGGKIISHNGKFFLKSGDDVLHVTFE